MHPHPHPQPSWPPQPPPDPGREVKKGLIWGTSILTFGPIAAMIAVVVLCCGGCIACSIGGQLGTPRPTVSGSP